MLAMYAQAKHIHEEKMRTAEQARLIAELRTAQRAERRLERAGRRDEGSLLWAANDLTGKTVTIVNDATGERRTGRDPADWDRAVGHAVRQLEVGI